MVAGEATAAEDPAAAAARRAAAERLPMGRDPRDVRKGLVDSLPDWVGYGALYAVSVAPVLIAIAAISILFFNSLR